MAERRTIEWTVWDSEDSDYEAMPTRLVELIPWLQAILDAAPEEYRDKLEIVVESEYESSSVQASISYSEIETDEAWQARLAAERAKRAKYLADHISHERAELARLQAKYGAK